MEKALCSQCGSARDIYVRHLSGASHSAQRLSCDASGQALGLVSGATSETGAPGAGLQCTDSAWNKCDFHKSARWSSGATTPPATR